MVCDVGETRTEYKNSFWVFLRRGPPPLLYPYGGIRCDDEMRDRSYIVYWADVVWNKWNRRNRKKKGRRVSSVWRIKKKRRNIRETHTKENERGVWAVWGLIEGNTPGLSHQRLWIYINPLPIEEAIYSIFSFYFLDFFFCVRVLHWALGRFFSLPLYPLFPPFFFFAPLDMGLYILRIVCPLTGNWHSHPPCVVSLTPIDPLPARS